MCQWGERGRRTKPAGVPQCSQPENKFELETPASARGAPVGRRFKFSCGGPADPSIESELMFQDASSMSQMVRVNAIRTPASLSRARIASVTTRSRLSPRSVASVSELQSPRSRSPSRGPLSHIPLVTTRRSPVTVALRDLSSIGRTI